MIAVRAGHLSVVRTLIEDWGAATILTDQVNALP